MNDVITEPARPSADPAGEPDKTGKYLTFRLGTEEYGLSLLRVREIIALMEITLVPLTPDYVRGVMNLRGKVITVVDLRRKLGMAPTEDHDRKCIIVVDVRRSSGPIQMSILVDSVSEVLHIASKDIENAPAMNYGLETNFISGMARAKGRVKILLDIDVVLADSLAVVAAHHPPSSPPKTENSPTVSH